MPAIVLLKDLVDALGMQFDELSSYLDLDTGRIEVIHNDLRRDAEDDPDDEPDLPDWQKEEWEIAKRILSTDRFLSIPDKFEVNEWEIMQDFSDSRKSTRIRDDLLDAIHGTGAFRSFRHRIRLHKIETDWYAFRENALKQIAIEWCKENRIEWR